MSSTYREVSCYINNQTGKALTVSGLTIVHGESTNGGVSNPAELQPGVTTQLFYLHKTSGAGNEGIEAVCTILLPDGSVLNVSCANPYTWTNFAGDGSEGACWFYAMITGAEQTGETGYFVDVSQGLTSSSETDSNQCNASGVSFESFQVYPPLNNNLICATVTIYAAGVNPFPSLKMPNMYNQYVNNSVTLSINLINKTSGGLITLQGLYNGVDSSPAGYNTCPPMVLHTINNDGKSYNCFQAAAPTLLTWIGPNEGAAAFNLPNGDTFSFTWNITSLDGTGVTFNPQSNDDYNILGTDSSDAVVDGLYISFNVTIEDNS